MGEPIVRVQFEMAEGRVTDMDRLMSATGLRTRRELFESALTLFEWAVDEVMLGRRIAAVDEAARRYQPMMMPAFVTARRNKAKSGAKAGSMKSALTHLFTKGRR